MSSRDELLELARRGDLDSLRADPDALADAVHAFADAGDAASALELVGRGWRIWFLRGDLDAGSSAAAVALAASGAESVPVWRARALYADGLFAFRAGDDERSLERNEEALRIAREEGDVRGECESLELNASRGNAAWVAMEQHNLGWVELRLGHVDEAEARFRERDAQVGGDAYGDAWTNLNWAAVALARGQASEASTRFAAGARALEELGAALDPDDRSELDWLTRRLAEPPRADARRA